MENGVNPPSLPFPENSRILIRVCHLTVKNFSLFQRGPVRTESGMAPTYGLSIRKTTVGLNLKILEVRSMVPAGNLGVPWPATARFILVLRDQTESTFLYHIS